MGRERIKAVSDDFNRDDYIVSRSWRFTGVRTTVAGLHASVLLGLPVLIPATWLGLFRPVLLVWVAYVVFVFYLNSKWKITPFEWLMMMRTRFVKGNKWLVR